MTNDQTRLDEAKERYLQAEADIEALRTKIAQSSCPLKVGDDVTIVDGNKEYEGTVAEVGYALKDELTGPVVGAPTGWSVQGRRFLKGTREYGKWNFHFTSWSARLVNNKWTLEQASIGKALGIC